VVGRAVDTDPAVGPRLGRYPVDQLAVVGDLTGTELHCAGAERRAGAAGVGDDQGESGAGPQLAGCMVAVRLGLRTRRLLGPVVAGGPERRTYRLPPGGPPGRGPDRDGPAD